MVVILLIAFAIRLVSLLTFDFIDSGGGTDTVTYLSLARNLFSGQGFTEFGKPQIIHPPLYPILIGIFWKLCGDLLLGAQLVSFLAGALLVLPAYSLARNLFGGRAGLYAAALAAVFPVLVYGSVETYAESLYAFILLCALAVFWRTLKKGMAAGMLAAGILFGLAFLTHPTGFLFLAVAWSFVVLVQILPVRVSFPRFLGRLALLPLGFALAALPFWIFIHQATGEWSLSGYSHFNATYQIQGARGVPIGRVVFECMEELYAGIPPAESVGMNMSELARRRPEVFLSIVRYHLADGWQEVEKSARFLGVPSGTLFAVLGAAVGLLILAFVLLFRKRAQRPSVLFLAALFLPAGSLIVVGVEHRYFYAFVPLVLIGLAGFLTDREEAFRGRRSASAVFRAAAALLFLALLAGSAGVIHRKAVKAGIPYEYKLLGSWMKENIPGIEGEKVMMSRLAPAYYSGCEWNVFFWGDYPGLIAYLKERGIRYVIIDDWKLSLVHPDLTFLLNADPLPAEFEMVKEFTFGGRKVRLLRLVRTK
jgi:4-amino-4-deoxy-L-arabinose transferase-like glycosyltransferase